MPSRRPWKEELEIVDQVMKSVSGLSDPEEMVSVYWEGIDRLFPVEHYLSLSRRGVTPPEYLITRSSRFTTHFNPWKERGKLPLLRGGLLGEIAYANKPVIIEDLPSHLSKDDPGYFFLQGFQSLFAFPQYENGLGLNIGMALFEPGVEWDREMLPMMHWQASLFGRGTQNLVLKNQLQEALSELDRELQIVGQIQRSLLPQELPIIPGAEVAAHYETSARAGGDYYDFFPLGNDEWGLFIADVSGHGTPAAVLMAITHAIAHTRPGSHKPPAEVLADINRHLARSYTTSGTFVTAFYAVLDPATRTLSYSSAGHNPPRVRRGETIIPLSEASSLPLGIDPDERFHEATIQLNRGDVILLYTDGIVEAAAPQSDPSAPLELFGYDRLDDVLCGCQSPAEILASVREAVDEFTDYAAPTDDRTLVAIKCL